MNLGYEALLIALSVLIPAGLYAGPKLYKRYKKHRGNHKALEERRDAILLDVSTTLKELSGDVKCLYQVNIPQLEALEVTLRALHGEKVNGNVKRAIGEVCNAKNKLSARLVEKVGDA